MPDDSTYIAASYALAQLRPKLRITYGSLHGSACRSVMALVLPGSRRAGNDPVHLPLGDGGRLDAEHLAKIAAAVQTGNSAAITAPSIADIYRIFETLLCVAHGGHVIPGLTGSERAAA